MDKKSQDRIHMVSFWKKNKMNYTMTKSIDAIYDDYLTYIEELNLSGPINKYIFRTYIRKNGYNGGAIATKLKSANNSYQKT